MMLLFKKCQSYIKGGKCRGYCRKTQEYTCCLFCPEIETCSAVCLFAERILGELKKSEKGSS